uniref:Uncharacterized protein TCIL3000_10_12710 n=1 Tax=Trypanosoma congolense (strain IL3000) TaxID=1068625 RepID=G0UYM2_TRYCI|nr:unnamed protein product [Trypanosoma congolense IL3000]
MRIYIYLSVYLSIYLSIYIYIYSISNCCYILFFCLSVIDYTVIQILKPKRKLPRVMDGDGVLVAGYYNGSQGLLFPDYSDKVLPSTMDLPRKLTPIQWWYFNAHLYDSEENKEFAFFSSFSRECRNCPVEAPICSDACSWALIDVCGEKYHNASLVDSNTIDSIIEKIESSFEKGLQIFDPEAVVLDMVRKGRLPRFDKVMKSCPVYDTRSFKINYDNECFVEGFGEKNSRRYVVRHYCPKRSISVELTFSVVEDPISYDDRGPYGRMFHYYFPSMNVEGQIEVGGRILKVQGNGWYNRKYVEAADVMKQCALDSWAWFTLRLSDGCQLSVFEMVNSVSNQREAVAILTSNGTVRHKCRDVTIKETSIWTSLSSFVIYPVGFTIDIPSMELSIDINSVFAHQEFNTILSLGGFYVGLVKGGGTHLNNAVSVTGFHARKSGGSMTSMPCALKNFGQFVNKKLAELYPLNVRDEWITSNMLGTFKPGNGITAMDICDSLFRPIRSVIDRGGKSWRSMVFVAACNALSTTYFDSMNHIAIAELIHIGSLVIDDVEDGSAVRRGGKAVHIDYGIPTAINAGTACYFMAITHSCVKALPPQKSNQIYEIYFDMMKKGHVGQGLDIRGIGHLIPDAVRTGDVELVIGAMRFIHECKTGALASAMCRIACVLCDASVEVTAAMEKFGLGIGLAFQIIDDALNVKGFAGDMKEAGEDIREGKVTYPVAKALGKLDLLKRRRLWDILQERSSDVEKIGEAINLLNSVRAVDDSLEDARKIVNDSWSFLDPLIEDSIPKAMMRAFSLFLTERNC